jgi:hypothetical protein
MAGKGIGTPRPGNGGARPGAGRKPGVPTKMTEEARAIAAPYAKKALRELAKIGGLLKPEDKADSEQARVTALNIILDRAYGRPKQPVEGEMLHGVSEELRKFIAGNATGPRAFIGFDEEDQNPESETDGGPLQHH